jgi:hypothetical protein
VIVAVVVYVASTLQGNCVLRDRVTLRSLGCGLRLANSLLSDLVGMVGSGAANGVCHNKGMIGTFGENLHTE